MRQLWLHAALAVALCVMPGVARAEPSIPVAVAPGTPTQTTTPMQPTVVPESRGPSEAGLHGALKSEYREALKSEYLELSLRPTSLMPALVVGGVGVATIVVGAVVFALAYDYDTDEFNPAGDMAGLILMPVGAALVLTSAGLLGTRVVRRGRMSRIERLLAHTSVSVGRDPRAGAAYGASTGFSF